jgi:hypothetical protein
LLEEVISAAGVTVWPMVEFEADGTISESFLQHNPTILSEGKLVVCQ